MQSLSGVLTGRALFEREQGIHVLGEPPALRKSGGAFILPIARLCVWDIGAKMSLVLKCDAQNLAAGNELFRPAPVWVYENCEPARGDEVFVWTTKASPDGGGLSMRGTLVECSQQQLSRNRPGASLTIRIEDRQPQHVLTVADLARYNTRRSRLHIENGPEVELCRKLLVNSHNKVAQLGAEEADLLRSFFDRLSSEATDASSEIERMMMWAERATRPGQQAFSERIRHLYRNRCAVTGCTTGSALQAAHIRVQDGVDDNSPWRPLLENRSQPQSVLASCGLCPRTQCELLP